MSDIDFLIKPLKMGRHFMKNRVIMPSCTRCRASEDHVPTEEMIKYYADRASFGLIITEGTMIQRGYSAFGYEPGIYTKEQVEAWRKVTKAVHDKGGLIFLQIMHAGRATVPSNLSNAITEAMGPTREGIRGHPCPAHFARDGVQQDYPKEVHPMSVEEIKECVGRFARAARNAMAAGFDGVQIQAGNGYLIDQFLKDSCNKRTDEYGGSIENRCRFLLEVVDAVAESIGPGNVGVRVSPVDSVFDMSDSDPKGTAEYVAKELHFRGLAFLEVVRGDTIGPERGADAWMREKFRKAFFTNFDYTIAQAEKEVEDGKTDGVSFGHFSVANPDLVLRIIYNKPLNEVDLATVCARGPKGYNDYPFVDMTEGEERAEEKRKSEGEADLRNHKNAPDTTAEECNGKLSEPLNNSSRGDSSYVVGEESLLLSTNSNSRRRVSFSEKLVSAEDTQERSANHVEESQPRHSVSGCQSGNEALLRPVMLASRMTLKNRLVVGSLARQRGSPDHLATDAMVKFYADRATFGLILSEPVEVQEGYYTYVRSTGVTSKEQVQSWRKVTEAVHDKGGVIYCVLHHGGRVMVEGNLEGSSVSAPVAGPTAKGLTGVSHPAHFCKEGVPQPYATEVKALRKSKLEWLVKLYTVAAKNAMAAGFDGVVVHAANGYLLDQFLRDGCNKGREDEYGGSIENRCRFLLEVVDAVAAAIGAEKVGVRLSPLDASRDMSDSDPEKLTRYLGVALQTRKVNFIEVASGSDGNYDASSSSVKVFDWLRAVYKGWLISDEDMDVPTAGGCVLAKEADLVSFTLAAAANADLVDRVVREEPLNELDRALLFTSGEEGYNTYPIAAEERRKRAEESFKKLEEMQQDEKAVAERSYTLRSRENSIRE